MLQSFNFYNQFIGKHCFKTFSRRTLTWKWRELLFVSLRVEIADFLLVCRCRWWQGTSRGERFSAEGPVAFRTILSTSAAFVSSVYPVSVSPLQIRLRKAFGGRCVSGILTRWPAQQFWALFFTECGCLACQLETGYMKSNKRLHTVLEVLL